jgi:hypothetical protein
LPTREGSQFLAGQPISPRSQGFQQHEEPPPRALRTARSSRRKLATTIRRSAKQTDVQKAPFLEPSPCAFSFTRQANEWTLTTLKEKLINEPCSQTTADGRGTATATLGVPGVKRSRDMSSSQMTGGVRPHGEQFDHNRCHNGVFSRPSAILRLFPGPRAQSTPSCRLFPLYAKSTDGASGGACRH